MSCSRRRSSLWEAGWGGQQLGCQDLPWHELPWFCLITGATGISAGGEPGPHTLPGEPCTGHAVERWVSSQVVAGDTYMPGKVREILSIVTEIDGFGTKGWLFIRFLLWD